MPCPNLDSSARELKVPVLISGYYWFLTLCAILVGDTVADVLTFDLHNGLRGSALLLGGLLLVVLLAQLRVPRYLPWLYWCTLVLVSSVASLSADILSDRFGVAPAWSGLGFGLALVSVLGFWYLREGTLSLQHIGSIRRELLYWIAILLSFALGALLGDLLAAPQGLGYAAATLIVASSIGVITLAFYFLKLNAIASFWSAFILMRPLADFFDNYLAQPVINGGQGLGLFVTRSIVLLGFLGLVSFLTLSRYDAAVIVADSVDKSLPDDAGD